MEKPIGIVPQGILTNDVVKVELLCAKLFTLSEESSLYTEKTFQADNYLGLENDTYWNNFVVTAVSLKDHIGRVGANQDDILKDDST